MSIYLNGRSLREYSARLSLDYTISGPAVDLTLRRGKNEGLFHLLGTDTGLLTLTLPLDFTGGSPRDIAGRMAALRGSLTGVFPVDFGDGFTYRCCLSEVGEVIWSGPGLCSQSIILTGLRQGMPMGVSGPAPLSFQNPATVEKTPCTLTLRGLSTSHSAARIILECGGEEHLTWVLDGSTGLLPGGDLILSGEDKRCLYRGGPMPSGVMTWREYPELLPGPGALRLENLHVDSAEITFTPTYI